MAARSRWQEFNDVAVLPDGGFIATHPTSLRTQGDTSDLFSGQPSGVVARWTPGKGEAELPGTRAGYPNGVLVSADGRYMYFNAWTAKEVHKYDLKEGKETGVVKLDFMPDNITWTSKHQMLAAGVKGTRRRLPGGQRHAVHSRRSEWRRSIRLKCRRRPYSIRKVRAH